MISLFIHFPWGFIKSHMRAPFVLQFACWSCYFFLEFCLVDDVYMAPFLSVMKILLWLLMLGVLHTSPTSWGGHLVQWIVLDLWCDVNTA